MVDGTYDSNVPARLKFQDVNIRPRSSSVPFPYYKEYLSVMNFRGVEDTLLEEGLRLRMTLYWEEPGS